MKYARIYSTIGLLFIALPFLVSSFYFENDKKTGEIESIKTNIDGKGTGLEFNLTIGKEHNHPTFAIWLEDMQGNYIQELYVTKSIASGIFAHGQKVPGVWSNEPGEVRLSAALPYFLHKRGIKAPDGTYLPTPANPIPDAYTGATPLASFKLESKSDTTLPTKFRIIVEVNQPWDWNEYWNNTIYIDDTNYKTSCQPALVYAVTVDLKNPMEYYVLNPIGHSHYSGHDGKLFTDLTSITTALQIFSKIEVSLLP
ncbi:MAG: hypothetical protein WCX31_15770 [Salinivirgaceae bacterium]|jgi:hypothetical protein